MNSVKANIQRYFHLELPVGQSAFLWGARKTGKSTYLKNRYPTAVYYDLLKSDVLLRLSKEPYLLREEVLALSDEQLTQPIIIDEVQKVPVLLDEIHWLIENTQAYFILCGSSARKLKRGAANLLGGRAWRFTFYPFIYREIPNFDLLHALNAGLIPSHYLSVHYQRSLNAYVEDYLTQEIQAEGLARSLPVFARFLDAVALGHGALINYSNIARDCGIDMKTVKSYYEILVDTLLGYMIPPYHKHIKRDLIKEAGRFYLFDVGLANHLQKQVVAELKGIPAGNSFEHFILMELIAYKGLCERDFRISFWRTKTGLEVDFILGDARVAIEVKISQQINKSDIKGLLAFMEDYSLEKGYVVCLSEQARKWQLDNGQEIWLLPYTEFLQQLWDGKII